MYRIDTGCKTINGERVDTFIRGIAEKNSLMEAEAGTNGYQGSDSRAYLRITALSKADFYARVKCNEAGQPITVELCFGGHEGLEAFRKALDFARQVLEEQITENDQLKAQRSGFELKRSSNGMNELSCRHREANDM